MMNVCRYFVASECTYSGSCPMKSRKDKKECTLYKKKEHNIDNEEE